MKNKNSLRTLDKQTLTLFLKIGFAEGISFIVLLFVAMPLKYFMGMPLPVRIMGMIHGVLFVGFAIMLLKAKLEYQWSVKKTLISFLLSFIPFGTFFLERTLKEEL